MRACRTLGAVEYDEFESHGAYLYRRIVDALPTQARGGYYGKGCRPLPDWVIPYPNLPRKKGTFAKRSTRWTEFMGQHWFQLRHPKPPRSVGTPRRSDRSDVPRGVPRCRPFIRFAWRRRLW